MKENIKHNKKQGLVAMFGINSSGIMSVPVNQLHQQLAPYVIGKDKLGIDVKFPSCWENEFTNYLNYTDKNFNFSYDYDRKIKSDVYRITVGNDVRYYAKTVNSPRYVIGDTLKVQKTMIIDLDRYMIEITIGIDMVRGNVNLLVKDNADNILMKENDIYFHSVTCDGLKEEVKKYINSKKECLEASIRTNEKRKQNYFLLHQIPNNALTISYFRGIDNFKEELQQEYYLYRLNNGIVIVSKPDNAGRVVVDNKIILNIDNIKYIDSIFEKTIINYLNGGVENKVVLSSSAYEYLVSECPEKIYQDTIIPSKVLEKFREDLKYNAVHYFPLWKYQLKLIKKISSYDSNLNEHLIYDIFRYLYQLSLKSNSISEFNLLLENDIFIHLYKVLKNVMTITFEELEKIEELYFENKSYFSSLVMSNLEIQNILYISQLNTNAPKLIVILLVLGIKPLIETILIYREKDNFISNNDLVMIKKNLYSEFTEDIAFEKFYMIYSKYYSLTFNQFYNKEELRRLLTMLDTTDECKINSFNNLTCSSYHDLYQTLVDAIDIDMYVISNLSEGEIENDYLLLVGVNVEKFELNLLFEVLLKVTDIAEEVKNRLNEMALFDEKDRYLKGNFTKERIIKDEFQQLSAIQTGLEFEHYLFKLFNKLGYQVEITKASGDQGADLILYRDGVKTVVQAKFYSGKVGNKAVQEVVSAIAFYRANNGMVVTNNYYTPSAIELAQANGIKLIAGDELEKMIQAVAILSV